MNFRITAVREGRREGGREGGKGGKREEGRRGGKREGREGEREGRWCREKVERKRGKKGRKWCSLHSVIHPHSLELLCIGDWSQFLGLSSNKLDNRELFKPGTASQVANISPNATFS